MKKRKINYLKLFLLLIFCSACNKDQILITPTNNINSYKGTYEFVNIIEFPKLKLEIQSINKKLSKTNQNNEPFYTINTKEIIKVKDADGYSNYSFFLNVPTANKFTFYNLIIPEDKNGKKAKPYIRKYVCAPEQYPIFKEHNFDLAFFKGKLYKFYLENFNNNLQSKLGNCDPQDFNPSDNISPNNSNGVSSSPNDNDITLGGGSISGSAPVCTTTLHVRRCTAGGNHLPGENCKGEGSDRASITKVTSCSNGKLDVVVLMKNNNNCPTENGDVAFIPTDISHLINPCKNFKKLAQNKKFKDKLKDLLNKTKTDNYETGYIMKLSNNEYNYNIKIGIPEKLGINFTIKNGYKIDGFIHNHYDSNNNKDLSVFSPKDLYSLYLLLKNNNINDHSNFVFAVTTAQNTIYAIHIRNKKDFIRFGDDYLDGLQDGSNDFLPFIYGGIDSVYFHKGIKNINSNTLNEKHFTKMLFFGGGQGDTGLELYKTNTNFNKWSKIKYNPKTKNTSITPCN
ncbi:hypothetical protein F7018_01140 [Tenacibaculum aiptasiae]|uniref:Uncharacterized protein n=1 Tax=Tenacibaculum aiptasiae TaxID=426481 RepID=A0A7J5ASH4_9FLAO|nr:hypothetical protein [Tenacibaculum aiptasiae]KAB1160509.1 hypothetical protein F7018_01140 [Tenacibaculum aiptasiae]